MYRGWLAVTGPSTRNVPASADLIKHVYRHGFMVRRGEGGSLAQTSAIQEMRVDVGRRGGEGGTQHCQGDRVGGRGLASSPQHHQGEGPTSALGHLSVGAERGAQGHKRTKVVSNTALSTPVWT